MAYLLVPAAAAPVVSSVLPLASPGCCAICSCVLGCAAFSFTTFFSVADLALLSIEAWVLLSVEAWGLPLLVVTGAVPLSTGAVGAFCASAGSAANVAGGERGGQKRKFRFHGGGVLCMRPWVGDARTTRPAPPLRPRRIP